MTDVQDGRKTVHLTPEQHNRVVETAFHDGRINIRQWIAEAVEYYLERTPSARASFRRKQRREEIDKA